jgi:CheY-like chemotaxis protein
VAAALPQAIIGDALRLRQVLTNLLNNAVKFTDEGSISVSAGVLELRSEDVLLGFEVADTGVGIDTAEGALLFDPFVQADVSTTRRYGGTGLGLAISRQLVACMDGEMHLDSKLGRGSVFSFTMPSRIAPTLLEPRSATALAGPKEADAVLDGARILLAEDNAVNEMVTTAMLGNLGCVVCVARTGAEAASLVESRSFDLVLMDCQMPDFDGFDATRCIRAREYERALTRLPIIALTAHAMAGDRERCLAAGMDDYLRKPFEFDDLRAVLRRWLGG